MLRSVVACAAVPPSVRCIRRNTICIADFQELAYEHMHIAVRFARFLGTAGHRTGAVMDECVTEKV